MRALRVIGVDPGPVPGIVVLKIEDGRLTFSGAAQCSANMLETVLFGIGFHVGDVLAVERFVVRGRATEDQSTTRDQVAWLEQVYRARLRSASQVKPWATDARLTAAGLLDACKGMRHARDAARHALFAAVHDGGLPDPLSKEWIR